MIAVMRAALFLVLCLSLPVGAVDAGTPPASEPRPLHYSTPITDAQLSGRTLRELTLMRNWVYAKRGNAFRRPWIDAFFRKLAWYSPDQNGFLNEEWRTNLDADELAVDDKNAERIATWESGLTAEQLLSMRDSVRAALKDAKKPPADLMIELRLLSVRLGGWAGEGPAPADLSPLENPARLDKLLTLKDLDGLSPRDLKLLRNTIYARHGRPFETPLVQGHFKTVQWYTPDPKYADSALTPVDKKNVKLIQSLEQQLKRAAEPNFMVAA